MFLDTDKAVAQVDGGRVKACGERVQEVRTVIGKKGAPKRSATAIRSLNSRNSPLCILRE